MVTHLKKRGMNLVVIRHPEIGREKIAKEVCDKIREALVQNPGPAIFLHDASAMRIVNKGYVSSFRVLDGCMPGKVVEFVCIAPNASPRLAAYFMSMFSNKEWSIFRNRKDAMVYLSSKGIKVEDAIITPPETVSVQHIAA